MYELQELCYYSVLEVEADASPATIVRAYRTKALKLHPDKNPHVEPEEFQAITQAYEVLSDPEKRKLYDHYGPALKPHMGESFAKLAPLLLSFVAGFGGSCAYTNRWLHHIRTTIGVEICIVGLAGIYYCSRASFMQMNNNATTSRRPKREIVSVSDYVAVSCMGLILGNLSGWLTTSAVIFCKDVLFGSM